ncbi:hypothetical protein ACFX1W_004744 [Malus domestica]
MGGRAIVRNSKQRAKSTGGIVDHDEHLGNAVEKTDGFRFWGRTIACDGEVNDERRIKIVRSCSINAPWNSGIGILSGRFASSRPKLGRRFQAEDLKSEGAMFGPKIAVWAEGVSSVGINSTAARTVDCLSKSRSRRVFESLLVEVISLAFSASSLVFRLESPRGRELFLPRPQSQDTEVSSALNATSTNLLLGRASADELARPAITEGRS